MNVKDYSRDELVRLASKHVQCMDSKCGRFIEESVRNVQYFKDGFDFSTLGKRDILCNFDLCGMDIVDTVLHYLLSSNCGSTAVLNPVHYNDFLRGGDSAEASLCHASYLHNVIRIFNEYTDNRINSGLFVPRVLFDTGTTPPVFCNVITSLNSKRLISYNILKDRLDFLLAIAADKGMNTVIIRACGDARDWIKACDSLLGITNNYQYEAKYAGIFDRVVISVPENTSSYKVVKGYLSGGVQNFGKVLKIR